MSSGNQFQVLYFMTLDSQCSDDEASHKWLIELMLHRLMYAFVFWCD